MRANAGRWTHGEWASISDLKVGTVKVCPKAVVTAVGHLIGKMICVTWIVIAERREVSMKEEIWRQTRQMIAETADKAEFQTAILTTDLLGQHLLRKS